MLTQRADALLKRGGPNEDNFIRLCLPALRYNRWLYWEGETNSTSTDREQNTQAAPIQGEPLAGCTEKVISGMVPCAGDFAHRCYGANRFCCNLLPAFGSVKTA